MERFAFTTNDPQDCVNAIDRLSQENDASLKVRGVYDKYPNGFLINDVIDAGAFLSETIKESSRKDKLSRFIASIAFLKKIGTSSIDIAFPSSMLEKRERISALKMINDCVVLWTDSIVYKIPASEKAAGRIKRTKDNVSIIRDCSADIQNCILIPKFIEYPGLILQYCTKCVPVSPDKNTIADIDSFLHRYFTKVFQRAELQGAVHRGFQHGDLHFRNLLKDKHNNIYLTDLDLITPNGVPLLDLMHFAVHLVRTIEQTSQYKPLESFLEDKGYLYDKLVAYECFKLSEIWLQYYHAEYIPLYMQSQVEWYQYNNVVADELVQLENLRQKCNV